MKCSVYTKAWHEVYVVHIYTKAWHIRSRKHVPESIKKKIYKEMKDWEKNSPTPICDIAQSVNFRQDIHLPLTILPSPTISTENISLLRSFCERISLNCFWMCVMQFHNLWMYLSWKKLVETMLIECEAYYIIS